MEIYELVEYRDNQSKILRNMSSIGVDVSNMLNLDIDPIQLHIYRKLATFNITVDDKHRTNIDKFIHAGYLRNGYSNLDYEEDRNLKQYVYENEFATLDYLGISYPSPTDYNLLESIESRVGTIRSLTELTDEIQKYIAEYWYDLYEIMIYGYADNSDKLHYLSEKFSTNINYTILHLIYCHCPNLDK